MFINEMWQSYLCFILPQAVLFPLILLFTLEYTDLFGLMILLLQIICLILSLILIVKFQGNNLRNVESFLILLEASFIYKISYLNPNDSNLLVLLLKITELKLIFNLSNKMSVIMIFLLNIPIVISFVNNDQQITTYLALLYSTIIIYSVRFQIKQKQCLAYVEDVIKQNKESRILTYIDNTFSRTWYERLEQIPIGILILNQQNFNVLFKNNAFLQIFNNSENIEKLVLDTLIYTIVKRKRMSQRQTSFMMKTIQSGLLTPHNQSNIKLIQSDEVILYTLRNILQLIVDGKMREYMKKGYLEITTKFQFKGTNDTQQEEVKDIFCKVYYSSNETVLIFDDITIQTNLKKMEQRELFTSKIIDSFSHELRTPLNSAQIFLQTLAFHPLMKNELISEYLHPAINSLKLQEYLIRDIIDFTQFHLHQLKYTYENFALEDLIEEIDKIFSPIFTSKGIGLQIYVINSFNPVINSDFFKLTQILINCLANALKFSVSGIVKIFISGYQNYIQFSVIDQGIGIGQEEKEQIKLFLEQFCKNQDVSLHGQWKGLGLLISQMNLLQLAPHDKQEIQIQSEGLNKGTKITFRIRSEFVSNTHNLLNQFSNKRPTYIYSYTAPDCANGIQGVLTLASPSSNNSLFNNYQIQKKQIGDFFKLQSPKQSNLTDLESNDNSCRSIELKIKNLSQYQQKPEYFMDHLNHKIDSQSQVKQRRGSFSSISPSQESKCKNGLLTRLQIKEQQVQKLQFDVSKIQYQCDCYRVFSVDDDLFNQKALQVMLNQMGYNCEIAYNGAQAISKILEFKKCSKSCNLFCFILMDCQMPIMDGWATTKYLTKKMQEQEIPYIPIIGLTAFNSKEDIELCYQTGMSEVLCKPLKISELKQTLVRLFK